MFLRDNYIIITIEYTPMERKGEKGFRSIREEVRNAFVIHHSNFAKQMTYPAQPLVGEIHEFLTAICKRYI